MHVPSKGKWDWHADAVLDYNYGTKVVDLGDNIIKSYEMNSKNTAVDDETCIPPDKYGHDECVPAVAQKPAISPASHHNAGAVCPQAPTVVGKSAAA